MDWLIIFIIALIIELFSTSLISIWFCFGAISSYISLKLGAPVNFQIAIFFITSIALLIFTKPFVKKYLVKQVEPTNADAIINKQAIVVEDIDNNKQKGAVKIRGKIWTARSFNGETIPENAIVTIIKIEGVKTIVKK